MNIEHFGEFKTGILVPLEGRSKKDWAFIPNPLPPKWEMPERLWRLVAEARQCIGDLNGSGSRLQNPRLLLRPLQRREALRSSSLEGTYASPRQLLLFEKGPKDVASRESDLENQWREVHNCYTALRVGYRKVRNGHALNRQLFCELHQLLMNKVRGSEKNPGKIRTTQVHIGVDRRFNPPPPAEVEQCLTELEAYYESEDRFDPLVKAFLAHYQFESIHPFTDGNGRIGRVLLSLTIARWLGLSHPWLYLSEYFEDHRNDYIQALFRVSTHGEWAEWIELCTIGTIEQTRSAIARCEALEELKEKYKKMVSGSSPRLHLIIEMLFSRAVVSITEVRDKLDVTYHTARNDINVLDNLGIVSVVEDQYPKMYVADRILQIAYTD